MVGRKVKDKPKITFHVTRHDSFPDGNEWCGEQAHSCCAVLELGDINDAKVFPRLTWKCQCPENVDDQHRWDSKLYRYNVVKGKACGHPDVVVTDEDVLKAFKVFEAEAKKAFGMIVVYLLPNQDKGWIGRLVRAAEWDNLGRFYNPKTRHTLRHFRKVLRKAPTRRSRRKVRRVFAS